MSIFVSKKRMAISVGLVILAVIASLLFGRMTDGFWDRLDTTPASTDPQTDFKLIAADSDAELKAAAAAAGVPASDIEGLPAEAAETVIEAHGSAASIPAASARATRPCNNPPKGWKNCQDWKNFVLSAKSGDSRGIKLTANIRNLLNEQYYDRLLREGVPAARASALSQDDDKWWEKALNSGECIIGGAGTPMTVLGPFRPAVCLTKPARDLFGKTRGVRFKCGVQAAVGYMFARPGGPQTGVWGANAAAGSCWVDEFWDQFFS